MLSKQLAGLKKHVIYDASFQAFQHMMRGRIYIYIYNPGCNFLSESGVLGPQKPSIL